MESTREQFGFTRTSCACALCNVYCRHLPGALDPSDLEHLCPPGHDLLAWAELHLRARLGKPYPMLVPARGESGACHWHYGGQCVVHEHAPYSCAFFDAHMSNAEAARRSAATVAAIRADEVADGPYARVWRHLQRRGLVSQEPDRSALYRELHQIRRRVGHI